MKRIVKRFSTLCIAMSLMVSNVSALSFTLDGVPVTVNSVIVKDRALVPLREINDLLGYVTDYVSMEEIHIENPLTNERITISVGEINYIDNEGRYQFGTIEPNLIDGVTYAPLRLLADAFNIDIAFNELNEMVLTTSTEVVDYNSYFETHGYSVNELLIKDYNKDKDLVKRVLSVYNKYESVDVNSFSNYADAIRKDIEDLGMAMVNDYELRYLLVMDMVDYLTYKLEYLDAVERGVDSTVSEYNLVGVDGILQDRLDYIKSMQ